MTLWEFCLTDGDFVLGQQDDKVCHLEAMQGVTVYLSAHLRFLYLVRAPHDQAGAYLSP